jgi:hypothetical protein
MGSISPGVHNIMDIPLTELKTLLQKSGNRCAFPQCGALLVEEGVDVENPVVLSKVAHIVARTADGPRGDYPLTVEERNREANLLLLCAKHHDIIDRQYRLYTVERLRQIKEDHEALVLTAMGDAIAKQAGQYNERPKYVHENLVSTLFPVSEIPSYVYGAPCRYTERQKDEIRAEMLPPRKPSVICPYIMKTEKLYAFEDLSCHRGPFCRVVDWRKVERIPVTLWWADPVTHNWFTELLGRSLNKLTGRKGLQWDKDHQRYYFQPDSQGANREVSYRPLNQNSATKQVVWQPLSKRTGQPRPYWLHRAVNLRFHHVSQHDWCLSIRPEFRVTKDGFTAEESGKVGSRVTRKKSRMFNYDLLGEVNFWRDFLSDGGPRMIFDFGRGQHIIVSTSMMQAGIDWPGIPEKFAKPFKNVDYVEDLFSWAKLAGLDADLDYESDEEREADDWEEDVDHDEQDES